MSLDSLKQIRSILWRTLLIGLIVTYALAGLTLLLWDTWTSITAQWFRTPVAELGPLMSNWFALIKFYMIYVLLVPTLGLHWEIKRREKKQA